MKTSGITPRSTSARIMPTCTAPRLPPPASTTAVSTGVPGHVPGAGPATPPFRYTLGGTPYTGMSGVDRHHDPAPGAPGEDLFCKRRNVLE